MEPTGTAEVELAGCPEIATPAQVAKLTGTTVGTLASWRWRGMGPAYVRMGRSIRYRREDVAAYIAANRVETAA
jgi:predicted DNA-binding transcriptional regulator AlpA